MLCFCLCVCVCEWLQYAYSVVALLHFFTLFSFKGAGKENCQCASPWRGIWVTVANTWPSGWETNGESWHLWRVKVFGSVQACPREGECCPTLYSPAQSLSTLLHAHMKHRRPDSHAGCKQACSLVRVENGIKCLSACISSSVRFWSLKCFQMSAINGILCLLGIFWFACWEVNKKIDRNMN